MFIFTPLNQLQQWFKHFAQPDLRLVINKGRMKTLFNKNALIEVSYTALHNIQPDGMKTDLEWLFGVVITEKGTGRTPDTHIEQRIYQRLLVFKVDVQRARGNAGLFGHHLHSDA